MKKNVVFINPGQFGYKAGYFYYSKYLAYDSNFNINFVCFDQGLSKVEIPEGVTVDYVDFSGNKIRRYLRWLIVIYKSLKQHDSKNSIFFMVYFRFSFIYTILFPKKILVLDIRTGSVTRNKLKNWLHNKIYLFESFFFKHITILSQGLINHIGIKPSKCHLLPLGSEIMSNNNKIFESINLLYVGTFDGRRIHETIDGLNLFIKKYNTEQLTISYDIFGFGMRNEISVIEEKIKEYNLQDIVVFHGRKNHSELKSYFDKCNVGVAYVPITSYYQHQPSTKIIEYALSGIINIATKTFENQQLINNENGLLCNDNPTDFASTLHKLSINLDSYSSNSIRNTLKNYEWMYIVESNLKPFLNSLS